MIEQNYEIRQAVTALQKGQTILYPTDTIWGLGCDATNAAAVENIFILKNRPPAKSLIVLVESFMALQQITTASLQGVEAFLDQQKKPTTIVYAEAKNLAANLIAADGTVAIRIPKTPFVKNLLQAFGKPLVSTSANLSGEATPLHFDEISRAIKIRVDFTFNVHAAGQNDGAAASSIYKLEADGSFTLLRA